MSSDQGVGDGEERSCSPTQLRSAYAAASRSLPGLGTRAARGGPRAAPCRRAGDRRPRGTPRSPWGSAGRGPLPAGTRRRWSRASRPALRPQSRKPRAKLATCRAATSPMTRDSSSSKSGCACASSSRNFCATSASPSMRTPPPRSAPSARGPASASSAIGVPDRLASALAVVPGRERNPSAIGPEEKRERRAFDGERHDSPVELPAQRLGLARLRDVAVQHFRRGARAACQYRKPLCRATMPPLRLWWLQSSSPASRIIASSVCWSGKRRIDSARYW